MSHVKKTRQSFNQAVTTTTSRTPVVAEIPSRITGLIRQENYEAAYDALRTLPRSQVVSHAMGVCAMRFGRADEAVRIFHSLSVVPGTTILRSDADDTLKANYALALLMTGLPSGAMDILHELKDVRTLLAVQIRAAIQNWVASLSFWRRLDWKFNRIDPPNSCVPIDFAVGVFPFGVDEVKVATTAKPTSPIRRRQTSRLAA